MRANPATRPDPGISLRQAALIAGFGLLIMTFAAPFAEYSVYARLVVRDDIAITVLNLQAERELFLAGIFSYLLVFILDLVVAWALYVLFIPVNRALSLLTAWFRLLYTALACFAFLKLVTVFRLLNSPEDQARMGMAELHDHVNLLLAAFRYEWSFSLLVFGIHLLLLAWLVYHSGYVPKLLGVLLAIAGAGWFIYELRPFFYPATDTGFIMLAFFGETIFMLWLVARGWKLREPGG